MLFRFVAAESCVVVDEPQRLLDPSVIGGVLYLRQHSFIPASLLNFILNSTSVWNTTVQIKSGSRHSPHNLFFLVDQRVSRPHQ